MDRWRWKLAGPDPCGGRCSLGTGRKKGGAGLYQLVQRGPIRGELQVMMSSRELYSRASRGGEVITPVLLSADVTGSVTEESDLDSALLQRCSLTPRKNVSLCVGRAA